MTKKLPQALLDTNFNEIFKLREESSNKVLVYDKDLKTHREKVIFRRYQCYLNTPIFNKDIKKSYMFLSDQAELPETLSGFVAFAKNIDQRYNQLSVNYYEKDDYIEKHSDCTANFVSVDSPILVININENDSVSSVRNFMMEHKESGVVSEFPLENNSYFFIENNKTHRHWVEKGNGKRVSLTFRMIREDPLVETGIDQITK